MIQIKYPDFKFTIKKQGNVEVIFDVIRKQWIRLTPEEWVRQNFIQYLLQEMNYPSSLIAIEKEILLGELKKRFDLLIYNSDHQPWMMIECKAMKITLDQKVVEQILRYNISIPVKFLVITNGTSTFGFERKEGTLGMLDKLPEFEINNA